MNDRIERQIELKAPVARVWRAVTDYREFGAWFLVNMEAPFAAGERAAGQITHKGYEHLRMEIGVVEMEPERLFSFTWTPYAVDPARDYSCEMPTLVEFRLTGMPTGTLLEVTESGFERVPEDRRAEAFRMNDGGWGQQMKNIEKYVEENPE